MTTVESVKSRFPNAAIVEQHFRDNVRLVVPVEGVHQILAFLKADHGFDMLIDVTAVDYLEYPDATDRLA